MLPRILLPWYIVIRYDRCWYMWRKKRHRIVPGASNSAIEAPGVEQAALTLQQTAARDATGVSQPDPGLQRPETEHNHGQEQRPKRGARKPHHGFGFGREHRA